MRQLKCKRSFELPFSWIFAIIAGVVIILIALYATTRFINTATYIQESEAGKQLVTMLNPVVNGMAQGYKHEPIALSKQTRISVGCSPENYKNVFGRQILSFSEESGFLKKWKTAGANISLYNKYIFANSVEEGKTINIFSKQFTAGFRVDDLIFMSLSKYCFISTPSEIGSEVQQMLGNVNLSSDLDSCPKNTLKVCFEFSDSRCNASVFGTCTNNDCENMYETGYVSKNNRQLQYYGSLMYGAIFASPDVYECNVGRLGKKISELGKIYKDKIDLVKAKGCNSIVGVYLDSIIPMSENLSSMELPSLYDRVKLMDAENDKNSDCKIYEK